MPRVHGQSRRATPTARELRGALAALGAIGDGSPTPGEFARRGVALLSRLVDSDITTLSVCDLVTGRRRVVANPAGAIAANALAAFDRHFFAHPLVRFHATHHDGGVHRISDSMTGPAFRATPLYADYYLSVGLDHSLALPLHVDGSLLVSFVLNRGGRDFADHERALLEHLRGPLANLFRASVTLAASARIRRDDAASTPLPADRLQSLTAREREVLGWVTAGKTNAQIGAILGTSPRTVAKHLERIYEKLGVESRTAAAMRATRAPGSAGQGSAR
jgi:DNA-binding CsgD family transcriptional regulator